jgi:hypothetical protein
VADSNSRPMVMCPRRGPRSNRQLQETPTMPSTGQLLAENVQTVLTCLYLYSYTLCFTSPKGLHNWYITCRIWGSQSSEYGDSCLLGCSALMMEAERIPKTLVNFYHIKWHYNPEDSHLQYVTCSYKEAWKWELCFECTCNGYVFW